MSWELAGPAEPSAIGDEGDEAALDVEGRVEIAEPLLPVTSEVADEDSAGAVARQALHRHAERFARHAHGLTDTGDQRAVWQCRVAMRRIRSDLRTFMPLFDAEWTQRLRDELSTVATALGDVRDRDVLDEHLQEWTESLSDEEREQATVLHSRLARERDRAAARLHTALRNRGTLWLQERIDEAAQSPRLGPRAARPAELEIPALAARPWRRLRLEAETAPADPSDEWLHALRIRVKRARYAADAAAPVVGDDARLLAERLAELQTVLGRHQDATVAGDWLRSAGMNGQAAFVAGRLAGSARADADTARAQWRAAWRAARKRSLRRWMLP